jgi:hypothetical protein
LALRYASEELQTDRDFVLAAVKENGLALRYASEELQKDRDFVLAAVKENALALRYTKLELQEDPNFVLAALEQNGLALQYAHYDLQKNPDIVKAAVQENPFAILYQQNNAIGFKTGEDKAIHLKAFKEQAKILATIPKQSDQYQELHWAHVKHFQQLSSNNIDCISYMFTGLKLDPRMITTLLSRNDISELNNCLLAMLTKDVYLKKHGRFLRVSQTDFIEKLSLKDVKNELFDLTFDKRAKWDDFIYFLKDNSLVQNDELRNLVFTTRGNPSQSASSGSAGVAAEPQPIAAGSSSGTRGGEYPSVVFAPQPRGAGAATSSSGSR